MRCGAEIVELSERFYRGSFLGITALVGVAAVAALVLLPLRAGSGGVPIAGVIGAGVLVVATPLAIWRTESLYRALRGRLYAEVGVVLFAAALVAAVFPLRSQLWWPSCTLLTLVAVIAPIGRVLGYCVAVLAINLLAHRAQRRPRQDPGGLDHRLVDRLHLLGAYGGRRHRSARRPPDAAEQQERTAADDCTPGCVMDRRSGRERG